ncbi:MAG: tetratricopeptide repeat protein [Burkholderiaceae bacterium]
MPSERSQQIESIQQRALELAPEYRSAFIERACEGDESLRREVEALIHGDGRAGTFVEAAVNAAATRRFAADPSNLTTEKTIGPYKLIREIGRGGMGAVYLAVRDDDQYRKRVAIKLIRRGMDTEEILSRFRHERQILASLDHPNIARLLHGDMTDEGMPYFVMEYVEGLPLDKYCDQKKLSTTARLKLFLKVCAAVHYAHQNLVVHRDLKPGNIFVTAEGEPKLLDFGIAKLLNPELYGQTLAPTAVAQRPMTPDYASPEQVRGQKITTASDVYTLGVLLYELLTGHRPYRFKHGQRKEMERVICDQEPEKPSTAINRTEKLLAGDGTTLALTPDFVSRTRNSEPDKLRRKLIGDLDNVVLMAMRKEPERRYASVEQFAEDIRRHLDGRPVIARKNTFGYRAEKFVRRRKVGVMIGTAFALLIIASAVAILVQSSRVAHQRDIAARERVKAERVSGFLADIFKVLDPSEARGNSLTAREILDKGAERVERELGDQPEVQATLLNTIGAAYRSLGLYDKAVPLLEKSLAIRRQALGNGSLEVAQSLYDLGWAWYLKQRPSDAEPLLRESLAVRRKLSGNENAPVADCLNLLALVLHDKGDVVASESLLREALAMRRKLFGSVHHDVAQSLNNVGLLLVERGDYDAAEPILQEAIAIDRKTAGADDPELAIHLNTFALLKRNKGDFDAAESLHREALAIQHKLFGNEHAYVATSLNNLAHVMRDKGNYPEAETLFREALRIGRKIYSEESENVALYTQNLAKVLYEQGDLSQSEGLFRQSLATFQKLFGDDHRRTARCRTGLALLLYDKGEVKTAEELLRQALETQRKIFPNGHRDTAETLVALGLLLTEHERAGAAEALLREALSIDQRVLPKDNWQSANAQSALGECLAGMKRFDEAETLLTGSYAALKAKRGETDLYRRRAAARLLSLYQAWAKPDKAAQYRAESNSAKR